MDVKEIITYREPTRFFSTNSSVDGMIYLRDTVITVINPKVIFNIFDDKIPTHIIILELGHDTYLGLEIDEITDIINVEESEKTDTDVVLGKGVEYIDYVINKGEVIYNNLSMKKLREDFYA